MKTPKQGANRPEQRSQKRRPERGTNPTSGKTGRVVPERKVKQRPSPGPTPRPLEKYPKPLFAWTADPAEFQHALKYQMERHGDTTWHLFRALFEEQESFDRTTLHSWVTGRKAPQSLDSFEILARIERRYRLPEGYFKNKLPHKSRSAHGHSFNTEMSTLERRRMAWRLPL